MSSTEVGCADASPPPGERRGLERSNNFTLIRVLAAALVIFDHSFRLVGQAPPLTSRLGYTDIGTIAVYTFFIMSGHLLLSSWKANPRFLFFFFKRFMRIMPGLAFSLLFAAFIIGPLVTTLPIGEYLHSAETRTYILQNLWLYHPLYQLPGVFGFRGPAFDPVNGSIWTLCYEVSLYLAVPIFGLLLLRRHRAVGAVLLIGVVVLPWDHIGFMMPITWLVSSYMIIFARYFLVGALLYAFRDVVPRRWFIALGLLAALLLSLPHWWAAWVSYVVLPYEIVYLARLRIPFVSGAFSRRDPSYGMYILAFPIQQTVVNVARGHISPLTLFAVSVPLTVCCALFSWTFVEAPAMRLRGVFGTRRRLRLPALPALPALSGRSGAAAMLSRRMTVTVAAAAMAGVLAAVAAGGMEHGGGANQLVNASAATISRSTTLAHPAIAVQQVPRTAGSASEPKPVLIYLHGLGEPPDHPALPDLLAAARADGYQVIFTDEGGLTSWGNKAAVAAVAALKAKYSPDRPVTLIGCSMGTLTLLSYLAAAPPGSVSAAVGLLPFSHLPTTEHLDTVIPSGATNPPTVVNVPYQLWWGTADQHAGTPTISGPQVTYVPMVGEGHALPIPYNLPAIFKFLDKYRAK